MKALLGPTFYCLTLGTEFPNDFYRCQTRSILSDDPKVFGLNKILTLTVLFPYC